MNIDIITKEDLKNFKAELLNELKEVVIGSSNKPLKSYLKSPEVRKILGISSGKLQQLRIMKILPFTKITGTFYYKQEDVITMLDGKAKV